MERHGDVSRPLIKSLFLKITPAKMRICGYKKLKNRTFSLVSDVSLVRIVQ